MKRFGVIFIIVIGCWLLWPVSSHAQVAAAWQVRESFFGILARYPRTDEAVFWETHYPGTIRLEALLNQTTERDIVLTRLYQDALKRDPQDYEREALKRFVAPVNRIREQLYTSAERQLALADLYRGILGRRPIDSELAFYVTTRSPFDRIRSVLIASDERAFKVNELYEREVCRPATDSELATYRTQPVYLATIRRQLRRTAEYQQCHPEAVIEVPASSLLFGLTHFHYYGDLGGIGGSTFSDDQEWAARTVDLAIIGWGDSGMDAAWQAIRAVSPSGNWLKWRLGQVFNTYAAGGSCSAPVHGDTDWSYATQQDEFDRFVTAYPEYGSGESCFLHAATSGTIRSQWHTRGCTVDIPVTAGDRLETLIWDQYGQLYNIASPCLEDFLTWRTLQDIQEEGYGGVGYDNLGSPLSDGYYLPLDLGEVRIAEIDTATQDDPAALHDWYYDRLDQLLTAVTDRVRAVVPTAKIVYNGSSYCSWDGGVGPLEQIATAQLGVWCEDALQYPSWGVFDDGDRLETLRELSAALTARDGFVALEAFSSNGNDNPTEAEAMYYLATYYLWKHGTDILAFKPDWNPYQPMMSTLWFDVFRRDIGSASQEMVDHGNGIVTRRYQTAGGQETLVAARVAGAGPETVTYTPAGSYCRLAADGSQSAVTGPLSWTVGTAALLLQTTSGCPVP